VRLVTIYLVGYFILLAGATWALWQSGMLQEIPDSWLALGAALAVALGILLAVASRSGTVRTK
jgi:energy-converting hydrogenase Eha subunit G